MQKWVEYLNQYRFHFSPSQSPTYLNLFNYLQKNNFRFTRYSSFAHFSDKNFQFDTATAEHLEFKHLLARLVNQYCPHIMPETYVIHDRNWSAILSDIADKYYLQHERLVDQVNDLAWILKPSLLNNGQQIKIFERLSHIEEHYLNSNRVGGYHILQRYLTHPDLLDGNKYSIRMFVVMTNYAGIFIYPHGYVNVALLPYQFFDFSDLRSHLTNEHLHDHQANVVQIPTQELKDLFSEIYLPIKSHVKTLFDSLKLVKPQTFIRNKLRQLAIMGIDFMVDQDKRVWLLECNHGPCFPTTNAHPLQEKLYTDFWQSFIQNFALPIAKRQSLQEISYQDFQAL